MQRIVAGMIVEFEGRRGVTVNDFMGACSDDETPVVFDGESAFLGVLTDQLYIGRPENPVADFDKCGAGQGAACCVWLTGSATGACCERHSSLRYTLQLKRDMKSKRQPIKAYPNCQDLTDGVD